MAKMDQKLKEFQNLIFEMSGKVFTMHEKALKCALSGDVNIALDIIKTDEYVNNWEFEINDLALDILALLAPVANDLRIILCGIKIATDLERIGDYAKNIGQLIIRNGKVDDNFADYLEEVTAVFFRMFQETMKAYENLDDKAAMELPKLDDEVHLLISDLTKQIEKVYSVKKNLDDIARILSVARCYERSSDHTKNINEHLIYQVKGQHYDFG